MFRIFGRSARTDGKGPHRRPAWRLALHRGLALEPLEARRVLSTFTVNTSGDVADGSCDADHCSLREAIIAANAQLSEDGIVFSIDGGGAHTVQLTSELPAIAQPVIFDGKTQPDATETPTIQLDGMDLFPGDICFDGPAVYRAGWTQKLALSADLNADGNVDLVVGSAGEDHAAVLLGNGDGSFGEPISLGVEGLSVTTGDFDGDGILDVATGYREDREASLVGPYVYVLKGNGDGTFGEPDAYEGLGGTGVTAGDLDGDGDLDLAVANRNTEKTFVLLGHGDGKFTPAPATYPVGMDPVAMIAGDLDGQNGLDLVVANSGENTLSVLLNKGDGTFADTVYLDARVGYWGGYSGLVVGDLDNDGDLDLAVGDYAAGVSVLLGAGDGTFSEAHLYPLRADTVAVGDVDGDGDLDLVVGDRKARGPSGAVRVLVNLGDGTFDVHPVGFAVGWRPEGAVLTDLDGDEDLDLAVVSDSAKHGFPEEWGTPTISILLNRTITADSPDPGDAYAAGDANQDGQFDQLDLVQILQANKYLTGEPASWQEGDWNGDDVFDQLDIAFALATSQYL